MRLVFHGALKNLVGDSFEMNSANVKDAIEGFTTQHPGWPRDMAVQVPGYDTPELMQRHADEVHIMPALTGGGGKFVNFVVGAAMIVVGVALVVFTGGMAAQIGISLIISGSLMVVQGIIQLFMKAPTIGKNVGNPEDSKYFGVNANTTAIRTPITMAWGRVRVWPHWISLQSDSSQLSHGSYPSNIT